MRIADSAEREQRGGFASVWAGDDAEPVARPGSTPRRVARSRGPRDPRTASRVRRFRAWLRDTAPVA